MLKILQVSDIYYPHIGGVSEHINHLSDKLEEFGHRVNILTGDIEGDLKPDESRVIRVGKSIVVPANRSYSRITVGVKCKELYDIVNDYDVIHIHGTLAPTLPLLTLKVSRTTNVFTFHPTFAYSCLFSMLKGYLQNYFKKIDGRIAVSKTARESISQYFSGEYRLIPNGVDVRRFNPKKAETNPREILFVGRIEPRKGLQYLLDAMVLIKKEFPDVKLTVAGGGYKKINLRVPESIIDSVDFLGFVEPEELPEIFSRAGIFISPAVSGESFGIVLIEAMASGTPVIASAIPGYECVIRDGVNGLTVPPGDVESIKDAVIHLLRNDKLKQKLKKGGLESANLYSWDRVAGKIVDFYHEINPSLP